MASCSVVTDGKETLKLLDRFKRVAFGYWSSVSNSEVAGSNPRRYDIIRFEYMLIAPTEMSDFRQQPKYSIWKKILKKKLWSTY